MFVVGRAVRCVLLEVGVSTRARRHSHVYIHPSVVDNSFSGTLCTDGSLLCKRGAEGDKRDVKSRRSTQTPMNFFVQRIAPCPQCYLCSDAVSGHSSGHHTKRCRGTNLDRGSSQTVALLLERAKTGAHRLNACTQMLGNESGGCSRTLKTAAMTALR